MAAPLRRRSKWIVLLSVPLFFALQFGLGLQLELGNPASLDGAYSARLELLRHQLAFNSGKPFLLMMGSSRTMTGFRPDLLQDRPYFAFNFGREGTGPVKNLIYLRRLLEDGIRPDRLIVDITMPALAQHRDVAWENRWVEGSQLSHGERALVEEYHDLRWKVFGQWLGSRLVPSWRGNRSVVVSLSLQRHTGYNCFDEAPGMDLYGYRPVFTEITSHQRQQLTQLAMSQYGFLPGQDHLAEGARRAVFDLIALCEAENIKLSLVVMPEGTQFHALYRPSFLAECNRFLAEVQRRTTLINAHSWIEDEHFFDQHHLLPTGAAQFTLRLAEHLKG